jgi:hypothetical protein
MIPVWKTHAVAYLRESAMIASFEQDALFFGSGKARKQYLIGFFWR